MSFSNRVKNECAKITNDRYILPELTAFFRVNGTVQYHRDNIEMKFVTEHNPSVRRIYTFFRKLYDYRPTIYLSGDDNWRKKTSYTLIVDDSVTRKWLDDTGLDLSILGLSSEIPEKLVDSDEKRRAYIRGSFLGSGSVSGPDRRYHLEIVSGSEEYLENFNEVVENYGIGGKTAERNGRYLWYLKDGETISDFLSLIGAYSAVLAFEDTRAMKDIKNNVNRRNNCELANLDKTLKASVKQRLAIEKIDREKGLENIDSSLREIALLRLEYPDISLKKIGEKCDPPLSKSGTDYRIRKLLKLAEDL